MRARKEKIGTDKIDTDAQINHDKQTNKQTNKQTDWTDKIDSDRLIR